MILQDLQMIAFWSFWRFGGRRMGSVGLVFRLGAFLPDHAGNLLATPPNPIAALTSPAANPGGGSIDSRDRGLAQCVQEG